MCMSVCACTCTNLCMYMHISILPYWGNSMGYSQHTKTNPSSKHAATCRAAAASDPREGGGERRPGKPSLWKRSISPALDITASHNVKMSRCRHRRSHRAAATALPPSVTKIRYFGTYLRYLPTNPTSHHCDNIPANPSWITDIFRYHFRISTSSSTVELVRFFLETLELVMHPCLQNSILSKSLLG